MALFRIATWKEDKLLKERMTQYVKEGLKREEILSFLKKDFDQYAWSIRSSIILRKLLLNLCLGTPLEVGARGKLPYLIPPSLWAGLSVMVQFQKSQDLRSYKLMISINIHDMIYLFTKLCKC